MWNDDVMLHSSRDVAISNGCNAIKRRRFCWLSRTDKRVNNCQGIHSHNHRRMSVELVVCWHSHRHRHRDKLFDVLVAERSTLLCVVRCVAGKPRVTHAAANRGGPRTSLSKRRSSSVGNKARLAASHQSASVPASSSSSLASQALSRAVNTARLSQLTDKVLSIFVCHY